MLPIAQFHPILVHFPIVFFLSLAAFDVVLLVRGGAIAGRTCSAGISTGLAVLAGLSAIVTFVLGDLAYDAALAAGFDEAVLESHEGMGTTTAIAFLVWALIRVVLWWRQVPVTGALKTAAVVLEVAGVGLIVTTAYLGGHLVYELGVNVAHAAG